MKSGKSKHTASFLSRVLTPVALAVFGEMASEEYEQVIHNLAAY